MSPLLSKIGLTPHLNLLTDVENRSVYSLSQCELNVFETYRPAEHVGLRFQNVVITSMVRGKKIMHLPGLQQFDYYPGETVLAPAGTYMEIDFPEAEKENPTQCIALTLDSSCISQALNYLNEHFPKANESIGWNLNYQQFHLKNSNALAEVINKLVNVCKDGAAGKDILADLMLKELIVRLVQAQSLEEISATHTGNQHPFSYVVQYIREHLNDKLNVTFLSRKACMSRPNFFRIFKREYGISPAQFIIKERLHKAKQLLAQTNYPVGQVSLESGFEDVNHFIRIFKRGEGITPKSYRNHLLS